MKHFVERLLQRAHQARKSDRPLAGRRAAIGALLTAAPAASVCAMPVAIRTERTAKLSSNIEKADSTSLASDSWFQYGYSLKAPLISVQVAGTSQYTCPTTCLDIQFETTHSGGTPAQVVQAAHIGVQTSNQFFNGHLMDGPATNHWGLGITHNSSAVASLTAKGTAGSQHGGVYSHFVRYLPPGGYPQGKTGAQGWSTWIVAADTTKLPSSKSGALSGMEMDLSADGLDDGGGRYGIQATLSAGSTGVVEWRTFLYVNAYNQPGNQGYFRSILELFAPYTTAAIDLSQGTQGRPDPLRGLPDHSVAIKLRAGQKYGLNGDGLTGQFLTYDAAAQQTELWANGRVIAAFRDNGGIVIPEISSSPSGLPPGSLYCQNGLMMRVS